MSEKFLLVSVVTYYEKKIFISAGNTSLTGKQSLPMTRRLRVLQSRIVDVVYNICVWGVTAVKTPETAVGLIFQHIIRYSLKHSYFLAKKNRVLFDKIQSFLISGLFSYQKLFVFRRKKNVKNLYISQKKKAEVKMWTFFQVFGITFFNYRSFSKVTKTKFWFKNNSAGTYPSVITTMRESKKSADSFEGPWWCDSPFFQKNKVQFFHLSFNRKALHLYKSTLLRNHWLCFSR